MKFKKSVYNILIETRDVGITVFLKEPERFVNEDKDEQREGG